MTQLDYKDATNFVLKTFESLAAGLLFTGEWDTLFKGMTATGTARGAQEYANGDLLYHTSSGVYDPSLGKVLTSADLDPWNGMWNEGVYHKIGIAALAIGASVITGGAAAIAIGGLVTSGLVGTVIAGAAAGLIGGATYAAVDNSLTQLRQTGTIDGGQLLGAVADGAKWGALAGGVFAAAGYGISRGIQALKNRFGSAAAKNLDEVAEATGASSVQPRDARGRFMSKSNTGQATPGEAAVDDFILQAKENGMKVVRREATVRTPYGNRRYDLVIEDRLGRFTGVEIKSSRAAFSRFDKAARQQFAADRWLNTEGGLQAVGKNKDLFIDNTIKILWEI